MLYQIHEWQRSLLGPLSYFAEANARIFSNTSLKLIFEADLVTLSEFWLLASQMRKLREFSGTELLDPRELDASLLRMRGAAREGKIVECAKTEGEVEERGSTG